MVVAVKNKSFRPFSKMIRVDESTLARLKQAAGDKPLTDYLDQLSLELTANKPITPADNSDGVESSEQLQNARKIIMAKQMASQKDSIFTTRELKKYDRDHLENTPGDCGFYHRDAPGQWHLVQSRADDAAKDTDLVKDYINAYYDYLESLKTSSKHTFFKKLAIKYNADPNSRRFITREVIIETGKEILEAKNQGREPKL